MSITSLIWIVTLAFTCAICVLTPIVIVVLDNRPRCERRAQLPRAKIHR